MTVTVTVPKTRTETVLLGGRYHLDHQITSENAAGADGVTLWQAFDELLRRPVAVHLLPAWSAMPAGLPSAIQAAARITDTRLTAVYDACFDLDCPYIVSEWPSDPSLEDLQRTGLPSPALAAFIVAEAAEAIDTAHRHGRPGLRADLRSVHYGRSGVKVTGLGINAAMSGADLSGSFALNAYALALNAYALVRVLYALLTGYWPADEVTALREPARVRPGVPAALNAIICQAIPNQPGWTRTIRTPAALAAALRATYPAARFSGQCAVHPIPLS